MLNGRRALALIALLGICGAASMAAGALSYQTITLPTTTAERRLRVALKEEANSAASGAAAIVERYGGVLGLGNLAKPKPAAAAPANSDPLSAYRLAGVVEEEGQRFAVFLVGEGDAQTVLTLRKGDEAAAQWVVESIGTTSAELGKAGTSRKFMLFE